MDFRPRQFQASQLVLLAHFAELTVREMEQELVSESFTTRVLYIEMLCIGSASSAGGQHFLCVASYWLGCALRS